MGKILAVVVFVAAVLLAAQLLYSYYAASSLTIVSVGVSGVNPSSLLEGRVTPVFSVTVYNPSGVDIRVERVYCILCFSGTCFSASHGPFLAPAGLNTTVDVPVDIDVPSVVRAVYHALEAGRGLNVTMKVEVYVPVELLGSITVDRVVVTAYGSRLIRLPAPRGGLRVAKAYWVVDGHPSWEARPGDRVTAVLELRSPRGYNGTLTVVVMRDLPLAPDEPLIRRTYRVAVPPGERALVEIEFTALDDGVRGYYLEVYVGGVKVYEMPPAYPPRLRLTG